MAKKKGYKYEYLGKVEVSLPDFNLTVKPGDIIKLPKRIDSPLFKEVK